jgi:colanic acid biosynthesis glycosyl transferase WcaI
MLGILIEVYYPHETGTGYYITQVAEHLALTRPVSVLCAHSAYPWAGVKAPRSGIHRGVHIYRCPSLVLHQRSIWARLIRMVSITLSMFTTA